MGRSSNVIKSKAVLTTSYTAPRDLDTENILSTFEKWGNVFQYADWGIAITRPDGKTFEMVNPAYAKMHGYLPSELEGKTSLELLDDESKEKLDSHLKKIVHQGRLVYEATHVRKDGTKFPVQVDQIALKDENAQLKYHAVQVQDISERLRTADKLEKIHEELEVRVQKRTAELKEAQERLKLAASELALSNKELEQFASVASHDLQEPLHIISNFLDLYLMKFGSGLQPDALEYIHYAQRAASQAQSLIRELLTYARIGTKVQFEPVDMNWALDQALLNLKLSIEENQAEILREPLPKVTATRYQMVQIFQNLVSNAIKYRSNTPPKIKISARRQKEHWVFSVRDDGIGIDRQHYDLIFEMFKRLHAKGRYSGSGIGLASCKKIVEYHGGKIWVDSEVEKGSTFYFTLPVQR